MRIPKDSERQLFIGATGSGKTTLGVYMLAHRNIDKMPFVILNTKDDELINQIPKAIELDGLTLPKQKQMRSGIYIARPRIDDYDSIEKLLNDIWERTHVGLFVDEALAISEPAHPAYRMLLTQGRSRRTPVDSLTQRPVWIDRYAFSESEHFYVMRLNDMREKNPIRERTGHDLDMTQLPEYHAYRIYSPTGNTLTIVPPAPEDTGEILEAFERKLKPGRPTYLI